MKKTLTLLLLLGCVFGLSAASGGPDQYGYLWKDNAEPDGPVYSWIDITADGIPITGLADDNTFGPYIMSGNMPYYWYDVKKVWIGSNGYVAFGGGNIAANFPMLPAAGGTDNYTAVFMADLTFGGTGNPAQCFLKDEATQLIISWINVPFWNVNAPGYSGSNTFQLILNKMDSTITMQYQSTSGTNGSNGPVIGIESITGSIGLARSQSLMPQPGYAVRFYNPADPLLQVKDAAVDWVGMDGTGGTTMAIGGSLTLATQVHNTGNQPLEPFTLTSTVLGPSGQVVLTEVHSVPALSPDGNLSLTMDAALVPVLTGTYRHQIVLSGITGEMIATNNTMEREIVVYSPTDQTNLVSWAGATDNGVGLAWNGGNGGIGAYIIPPFQPCQITATTVRITSNSGSSFAMMVYADDGPDGSPGTLLDSSVVNASNGGPGDHVYPLLNAIQSTNGGFYVVWHMLGPNVNIAVDIMPPFSLRCYEVLDGAWAEYRDRTITDFHLGLQIALPPYLDVGVMGLVGINNGQQLTGATTVQALVKNYGNSPATGFPVHYSFNNGPVATQNYTGNPIAPGNSALVMFGQQLVPQANSSGDLCVWTAAPADSLDQNDTSCVAVDVFVGLEEPHAPALVLWPCPAKEMVRLNGVPSGPVRLQVFDGLGKLVHDQEVRSTGASLELDVRLLPAGPYVVRCTAAHLLLQGRFMVEH
ncbi:MAG: hypothetical protein IT230_04550 [Flavobacteriales bacterium]|nr:hypothetical protein [Flavobacteriales bacterium]